jgi:hypothetical protein
MEIQFPEEYFFVYDQNLPFWAKSNTFEQNKNYFDSEDYKQWEERATGIKNS